MEVVGWVSAMMSLRWNTRKATKGRNSLQPIVANVQVRTWRWHSASVVSEVPTAIAPDSADIVSPKRRFAVRRTYARTYSFDTEDIGVASRPWSPMDC